MFHSSIPVAWQVNCRTSAGGAVGAGILTMRTMQSGVASTRPLTLMASHVYAPWSIGLKQFLILCAKNKCNLFTKNLLSILDSKRAYAAFRLLLTTRWLTNRTLESGSNFFRNGKPFQLTPIETPVDVGIRNSA